MAYLLNIYHLLVAVLQSEVNGKELYLNLRAHLNHLLPVLYHFRGHYYSSKLSTSDTFSSLLSSSSSNPAIVLSFHPKSIVNKVLNKKTILSKHEK